MVGVRLLRMFEWALDAGAVQILTGATSGIKSEELLCWKSGWVLFLRGLRYIRMFSYRWFLWWWSGKLGGSGCNVYGA